MNRKKTGWIWGSALLLYAASLFFDDAALIILFYWIAGLSAGIGGCVWGLRKGLALCGRPAGFLPKAESVWFGVMGCVGAYFLGMWLKAWMAAGVVRMPSAPWISGFLIVPSVFRLWRGARGLLAAMAALGIAGFVWQAAFLGGNTEETLDGNALKALPYMAGCQPGALKAAKLAACDPKFATPGMTMLVTTGPENQILLIDFQGNLLEAWTLGCNHPLLLLKNPEEILRVCEDPAYDNVVTNVRALSAPWMVNHDMCLTPEGNLLSLVDGPLQNLRYRGLPVPVIKGYILEFPLRGDRVRTLDLTGSCRPWLPWVQVARVMRALFFRNSLWKLLTEREEFMLQHRDDGTFSYMMDVFHHNSLVPAPRDIPGVCARGDLLVSPYRSGFIGVLNRESNRLVWHWSTGDDFGVHTPVWTSRGTIMMFENQHWVPGAGDPYSRVLEIDPRDGREVWEYTGDPPRSLRSDWEGSCQELPGGNVLVCISSCGRVFEITREGRIVWEYWHPMGETVPGKPAIWSIYRAVRLCDPHQAGVLREYVHRKIREDDSKPQG